MGYYVTLSEADWAYAAENQATCLLALQVMSSEAWNAMKNGGTTMSDGTKKYWWRWQSEQFPADCSTCGKCSNRLGLIARKTTTARYGSSATTTSEAMSKHFCRCLRHT